MIVTIRKVNENGWNYDKAYLTHDFHFTNYDVAYQWRYQRQKILSVNYFKNQKFKKLFVYPNTGGNHCLKGDCNATYTLEGTVGKAYAKLNAVSPMLVTQEPGRAWNKVGIFCRVIDYSTKNSYWLKVSRIAKDESDNNENHYDDLSHA